MSSAGEKPASPIRARIESTLSCGSGTVPISAGIVALGRPAKN